MDYEGDAVGDLGHSSQVLPTDSTYENMTNITPSGTMMFHPNYPKSHNDASVWASTHALSFNVGEVKLNDTWSTTFRMNLTQMGKIQLFGPGMGSQICFTDASTGATTCQDIQALVCNVQEKRVDTPFGDKHLFIDNMSVTNSGPDPKILTVKWNTTYDGAKTVQETISYRNTGIQNALNVAVPDGIRFEPNCFEKTSYLTIDTTTWAPGTYDIRVTGVAMDAMNPGAQDWMWTINGASVPKYIKLE
jgi:hypothetical protein